MPNPILKELEDLLDPGLPPKFTLWVPDAWLRGLLEAGMVTVPGGKLVATTALSLFVHLLDYDITLRADSDPAPWDTIH